MSKVALCSTADRGHGVRASMAGFLGGDNPVRGKRVLLKPNLNTADPAPGSTDNDALAALIDGLWELGAASITLGERSYAPTRAVMEEKGVLELCQARGVEVLVFDELPAEQWVLVKQPGFHWPRGFMVARPVVEAECLVMTGCLKTHAYGGVFTMSLKLAVGTVPGGSPYMSQLHGSSHQRRMIAEINAAFAPALVVMDGVEVFLDGGPMSGRRARGDVVLAGADRVALDAAGLALFKVMGANQAIMDTPIFGQEQIVRAVELGLGAAGPEQVELVPADDASRERAEALAAVLARG